MSNASYRFLVNKLAETWRVTATMYNCAGSPTGLSILQGCITSANSLLPLDRVKVAIGNQIDI